MDKPSALAIDAVHGQMYWSTGAQTIQRSNLNGTDIATAISSNTSAIVDIVVDGASGKIYWTPTLGPLHVIRSANLDGTMSRVLLQDSTRNFIALALDASEGKLYFSDVLTSDRIGRMNLDGSDRETVITSAQIGGSQIEGLAIVAEPSSTLMFAVGGVLLCIVVARRQRLSRHSIARC